MRNYLILLYYFPTDTVSSSIIITKRINIINYTKSIAFNNTETKFLSYKGTTKEWPCKPPSLPILFYYYQLSGPRGFKVRSNGSAVSVELVNNQTDRHPVTSLRINWNNGFPFYFQNLFWLIEKLKFFLYNYHILQEKEIATTNLDEFHDIPGINQKGTVDQTTYVNNLGESLLLKTTFKVILY